MSGRQASPGHAFTTVPPISQVDGTHSQAPNAPATILTPSRLRLDSRVYFAHCTLVWLSNAVFSVLVLLKLHGGYKQSWAVVFLPTWLGHVGDLGLQATILQLVDYFLVRQIGPPPPHNVSAALQMQYTALYKTRRRSHILDAAAAIVDNLSVLIVKVLIAVMLDTGRIEKISFRSLFTPLWISWACVFMLNCAKARSERALGSSRDLVYIFALFAAFKLDGSSQYAWRVVFIVPWLWFSAIFVLALLMLGMLMFARFWVRLRELLAPLGFFCLLLSAVPHFVGCVYLVRRLDGDSTVPYEAFMIPFAAGWLALWCSAVMLCVGLRAKERIRDELLASGAVWTAHEDVARRIHEGFDAEQRRVDNLSDEEVAHLVQELMAGKAKPKQLMRIGSTLYRRVASLTELHSSSSPLVLAQSLASVDDTNDRMEQGDCNAAVRPKATTLLSSGSSSNEARHVQLVQLTAGTSQEASSNTESTASQTVTLPNSISQSPDADDLCVICYENTATCVFLDCGHGGFCRRCANKLFIRPPNECPTCRQRIQQVVEVAAPAPVGHHVPVKE